MIPRICCKDKIYAHMHRFKVTEGSLQENDFEKWMGLVPLVSKGFDAHAFSNSAVFFYVTRVQIYSDFQSILTEKAKTVLLTSRQHNFFLCSESVLVTAGTRSPNEGILRT